MTKSEELYHTIAKAIPNTTESKMFGALCIKAPNGKAGVMFWKDEMVFKLDEEKAKDVLKLKGTHVFEPAKGRQMKGWYQVPAKHSDKWKELAEISMAMVKKIKK